MDPKATYPPLDFLLSGNGNLTTPDQHLPLQPQPLPRTQPQAYHDDVLPPYHGAGGPEPASSSALLGPQPHHAPHTSPAHQPTTTPSPSSSSSNHLLLSPYPTPPQQQQHQQQGHQQQGGGSGYPPILAASGSVPSVASSGATLSSVLAPSYPLYQHQTTGLTSSPAHPYQPQAPTVAAQAGYHHQQQHQHGSGGPGSHSPALGSYPTLESGVSAGAATATPAVREAGRDPVQNLLEAYPNPHTENQKIIKMLELIVTHMHQQYKRFDAFMNNVEERLGGLEAAVSQLALNDPDVAKRLEAVNQREKMERERERERSAPRSPPFYPAPTLPKAVKSELKKKKKKKAIVPEYETNHSSISDQPSYRQPAPASTDEVDEELARKLQAQFNAEAEIEALKRESISLSDEEYAQKLQGLYLKRDAASGQVAKKGTTTAATPIKKEDTKKGELKPEEKSLWSRLFGAPKNESDDDSEEDDTKAAKKTAEVTTIYPAAAAASRTGQASTTAAPAPATSSQMMAVPYYFPTAAGMPQQPFVMPQYAPFPMTLPPGATHTQYLYPAVQPPSQPQ